jgi:hypothetical protein
MPLRAQPAITFVRRVALPREAAEPPVRSDGRLRRSLAAVLAWLALSWTCWAVPAGVVPLARWLAPDRAGPVEEPSRDSLGTPRGDRAFARPAPAPAAPTAPSGPALPSCEAAASAHAVRGGEVLGVSVAMRPRSARADACVARAVSRLAFPSSARLDVVRTTLVPP